MGVVRRGAAGLQDGQGRLGDVPNELRKWNKAGGKVVQGLINRREKEIALWSGTL